MKLTDWRFQLAPNPFSQYYCENWGQPIDLNFLPFRVRLALGIKLKIVNCKIGCAQAPANTDNCIYIVGFGEQILLFRNAISNVMKAGPVVTLQRPIFCNSIGVFHLMNPQGQPPPPINIVIKRKNKKSLQKR